MPACPWIQIEHAKTSNALPENHGNLTSCARFMKVSAIPVGLKHMSTSSSIKFGAVKHVKPMKNFRLICYPFITGTKVWSRQERITTPLDPSVARQRCDCSSCGKTHNCSTLFQRFRSLNLNQPWGSAGSETEILVQSMVVQCRKFTISKPGTR